MAHRIDGRKLGRKTGPRMALYRNLIVSVLRYEQIQTTEARAKEVRGQVEQIITLAKQGTLASRRRIIAELPNEPLVIDKLINEIAARVWGPELGVHPAHRSSAFGPAMRPPSSSSSSSEPTTREGGPRAVSPHGWNTTGPGSPASRCNLGGGPSRESWRRRSAASAAGNASGSTGRAGPTPGSTPAAR